MSDVAERPSLFAPGCILMAVDPGLGGALAFYFPDHDAIAVEDMPVADGNVDPAGLAALLDRWSPRLAAVERVASRPGQGVASSFKFGCGYGMVQGVIAACGIPLHLVSPSKWKKHFLLSSDKEEARARALRLWPARADLFRRKRDHGRAEAALLARYAAEKILARG
jgi:crossover junction endodeoxyribonuclease RuvC